MIKRSRLGHVLVALRESAWTAIAAKVVLFVAALLFLAWIGQAATARATTSSVPPASSSPVPPLIESTTTLNAAVIDAGTPSAQPATAPSSPVMQATAAHAGRATPEDPVFVNHASAEELRRLPGVGVKRAEAIVQLRQRVGKFQRVEDLLRVKGIGRATLRKWRPLVRLDSPPPQAPALPSPTIGEDAGGR